MSPIPLPNYASFTVIGSNILLRKPLIPWLNLSLFYFCVLNFNRVCGRRYGRGEAAIRRDHPARGSCGARGGRWGGRYGGGCSDGFEDSQNSHQDPAAGPGERKLRKNVAWMRTPHFQLVGVVLVVLGGWCWRRCRCRCWCCWCSQHSRQDPTADPCERKPRGAVAWAHNEKCLIFNWWEGVGVGVGVGRVVVVGMGINLKLSHEKYLLFTCCYCCCCWWWWWWWWCWSWPWWSWWVLVEVEVSGVLVLVFLVVIGVDSGQPRTPFRAATPTMF